MRDNRADDQGKQTERSRRKTKHKVEEYEFFSLFTSGNFQIINIFNYFNFEYL